MSTIPAVFAALKALGVATLGNTWQAINGPVGSVTTTEGNLIIVGDDDVVGTRELNSMATGTTSERYTVPVVVNADVPGTDQLAADDLALDAYEALERAIREYPGGFDLGLAGYGVQQALPTGEFRLTRRADSEGRHAAVRFYVAVIAQNT